MARPKEYRQLIVWQKAMRLARQAYVLTSELPARECYGLVSQIRRAAVSVPSNIAEGHGRLTDLQFRHFLGTARGSLNEMQTQIELASDLGYLSRESMQKLIGQGSEVARLLNALLTTLTRSKAGTSGVNSADPPITVNTAMPANSAISATAADPAIAASSASRPNSANSASRANSASCAVSAYSPNTASTATKGLHP